MSLRDHYHFWRQGLAVDRPANPVKDMGYFATNTGQASIYDSGAAAWFNIGFAGLSDPVAIGDGGTGQTGQTAAYNALSPSTTKGDIEVHDGANVIRLAVAGNDYSTIISRAGATAGLEWRVQTNHVAIFSHPTFVAWAPGASYAPFSTASSECLMRRDMRPFREARIYVRGSLVGTDGVTVKIRDVDNSQDMTNTVTITSSTIESQISAWFSLNSATYGDDNCAFEAQGQEVSTPGDVLRTRVITLELR